MNISAKVSSILLMIALVASLSAAFEKPAVSPATSGNHLLIGSQDVITASDSSGGHLTTNDILLVILIVLAVFGLAAIL